MQQPRHRGDEDTEGLPVTEPAARRSASTIVGFALVLSVALVTYSSAVQLVPGFNALYVPLSLATTSILAFLASQVGLGPADLGLQRATMRIGFSWGLTVAALAAVVLAVAAAVPAFHPLFDDARIEGIGPGLLAYRTLVRIPFGTALLEEFAFRGVLLGALARIMSPLRAAAGSSLVFGLWHVRPAIDLLEANRLAGSSAARLPALTAAVVATAIAGYLLCLLRMRSDSLLASFIAHTAINSFAMVAAVAVAGAA